MLVAGSLLFPAVHAVRDATAVGQDEFARLAAREALHPELLAFEGGEFGGAFVIIAVFAFALLMIGLLAEE